VASDEGKGLAVTITSPAPGSYYREITVIEGRVGGGGDAPPAVRTFTWEAVGKPGLTGRVALNAGGAFKVPVSLPAGGGDVVLRLLAVDSKGRPSETTLPLHDGTLKPAIVVTSPAGGGATYGSFIRVTGTVTDPYAGQPGMEGIASFSWLLAPVEFSRTATPARGTLSSGRGGAFRLSLPATGLSGSQNLTLTVVAKSGNRAEASLKLAPGDGDLSSFVVTPADGRVAVRWAPAPFATGYDLSIAPADQSPEKGKTLKGVSSPVGVDGLVNGTLYAVQVKVHFDDGGEGSSPVVKLIPLSPRTLAPTVRNDYQQCRLSWNRIAGAASFDVWRSTTRDAGYAKIATAVPATVYVDTAVQFGRDYFYAITPAGPVAPMSAPVAGKSLAFPADKLARLGFAAVAGARRVTVEGGYAFVAAGAAGVCIVDVSAPKSPVAVGTAATADARAIVVRGDYAYVADGEDGLRVLDVSAPRSPLLLGTRRMTEASAVALSGSYAYVADRTRGVKVIDVSETRNIPRVATFDTSDARDLAVRGRRLFVADGPGGLKVYDITRLTSPSLVATVPAADARSVALMGNLALVADAPTGLRVVDITEGAAPSLLATFSLPGVSTVAGVDGFAYLADGTSSITVVSCEDPAHPSLFTRHPAAGAAAVSVVDRVAYVAGSAGLETLRIQIQGRSFRVASCATGSKAFDVTVDGRWAYVAGHAEGLRVVDVADPLRVTDASLAATLPSRFAQRVSVQGTVAGIADGSAGVKIVDVTRPAAPVELAAYRTGGTANRVVLAGHLAWVAAGSQGVLALDLGTPSSPTLVSSTRSADASDIALKGPFAFLADGEDGVKVLDISTPGKPLVLPGRVRWDARSLALAGDLLAAAGPGGVQLIDVSNPRAPAVQGRYDTPDAQGIAMAGGRLYVAEGYRGLTVLDVGRPAQPLVVSACADVFAVSVAAAGDYAVVADSTGIKIIRILIPEWLTR
jgi:hypothetical protein